MEKQKYDIEKELTNALQIVEGLLFNLWHKEHHLRSATLSVIHSLATLAPQKDSVTAVRVRQVLHSVICLAFPPEDCGRMPCNRSK